MKPSLAPIRLPSGVGIGAGRNFVIAEVGSNHAQSLETALASIDAAAAAGADAVKFQSINVAELYHKPSDEISALHRKIDLPEEWHAPLKERCDQQNVVFLSSPTYLRAVDILKEINVDLYKLASAQIAVFPQLVRKVAELGRPVILSTGLVTEDELQRIISIFREADNHKFVILHCNSVYPTEAEIVHLPRMLDYQNRFGCLVGFSDHTETNTAAIAAVAMGASVIEKHFTLSPALDTPDAPFSLEPAVFKRLVKDIREAEQVLKPAARNSLEDDESNFRRQSAHSLHATQSIESGEVITQENSAYSRGGPVDAINAVDLCTHSGRFFALRQIKAGSWIKSADVRRH